MRGRTTHSDLARNLEIHAEKLAAIPAGYLVGDASTRELIIAAARILIEQDRRIEQMTAALRAARDVLPSADRLAINEALAWK
jgi:hypothetical protein